MGGESIDALAGRRRGGVSLGGDLWVGDWVQGETRVSAGLSAGQFHSSFENAPQGACAPSPNADDDHDGQADEDRLNGLDDDGDGVSRP